MVYVRKEILRTQSAIRVAKGVHDTNLKEAQAIKDTVDMRPDGAMEPEDILVLKGAFKVITRQDEIDLPRLRKNVELLEGFTLKALKNRMHDDNKASQNVISRMKRAYEDLQKLIDALNAKLARNSSLCQSLKEQFNNEDLERTNEIYNELTSKLDKCNEDINAEKAAGDDDTVSPNDIQLNVRDTNLSDSLKENQMADSGSLQSLQARRKRIIKAINDMVQMFNENNKSVREAGKAQKTEREVSELIERNQSIIKTALGIDF